MCPLSTVYNDKIYDFECIHSLQSAISLYLTHFLRNKKKKNSLIEKILFSITYCDRCQDGEWPVLDYSASDPGSELSILCFIEKIEFNRLKLFEINPREIVLTSRTTCAVIALETHFNGHTMLIITFHHLFTLR